MRERVYIVAEAGVNHNGDILIAKRLVDEAKACGADAVKFQAFNTKSLVTGSAKQAEYQVKNTGSTETQSEILRELELDALEFAALVDYCAEKHIDFLCTPFDHESIDMLRQMGVTHFKIPSGEITNVPYLRHMASVAERIIMSTGMANLGEVEFALHCLLKTGIDKEHITILHATTDYPTEMAEVNLRAIRTLRLAFGAEVGYSDHTEGVEVAVAAVAIGAKVIEKHFTLNRNMEGPDHVASLEPKQLSTMIRSIRNVEKAMGNGLKAPMPGELKNLDLVRKSIFAGSEIKEGERFSEHNLAVKRPATGISPIHWDEVIGLKASKHYLPDDPIDWA